jgi:hypothetical protein
MTTIQAAIAESASASSIVCITVTAAQRAELQVRCEDCRKHGTWWEVWGTADGREWLIYATIA